MRKYGNIHTEYRGKRFDSRREARRYAELSLMEQVGEISGLRTQVAYELIPSQKDSNGKVVERAITYKADFVYTDKDGNQVVEDSKGYRTDVYKLKRKLMLYVHGITVKET